MSLYKFTHKLLLKVDVQLKQKIDKQPTKRQSPKFIKKEKSCPEKRKKVKKKITFMLLQYDPFSLIFFPIMVFYKGLCTKLAKIKVHVV